MSLLSLPTETILRIASFLSPQLRSLNSLSRTNQRLLSILEPILYTEDVRHHQSSCVNWAAEHGMMNTLRKALNLGGAHIPIHQPDTILREDGGMRVKRKIIHKQHHTLLYGKYCSRSYWEGEKDHPICVATRYGHEEMVRFLLDDIGCSPYIRDRADFSLLALAVICGQKKYGSNGNLIKIFLDLGVQQANNGFNLHCPIQIAAFQGDGNAVKLLLSEARKMPTRRQIQDAFETAINAGHLPVALQLLDHGIDLNFQFTEPVKSRPYLPTPLGWAIFQGDLDLVKTFLDKGADANFTLGPRGPALLDAVKRRQAEMVEILVKKTTNRVACTKALTLAVDLTSPDDQILNILLINGVCCNFEEDDIHPPNPDDDAGGCFDGPPKNGEFIPPIVLAVNSGNLSLVRLLVSHGADVNTGYHELWVTQSRMYCGRVFGLAMDLGYQDIVDVLLESGANPAMKYPRSNFHRCRPGLNKRMARKT